MTKPIPKLGAIAVVYHADQFLMVKRRKEPNAGTWGFPGGHVELGETGLQAAARELLEETGVVGTPLRYLTNVDAITRDRAGNITFHFLLAVVLCRYEHGTPRAADDADDAGWFTAAQAAKLNQSLNVQDVIDMVKT